MAARRSAVTLGRMFERLRSVVLAVRASYRYGRAVNLRDAGNIEEALRVAREALALLARPGVVRGKGPEGSVLSCATVMVEDLASRLGVPGAAYKDIADTLTFIRVLGPGASLASWTPYLEHRAAEGGENAA